MGKEFIRRNFTKTEIENLKVQGIKSPGEDFMVVVRPVIASEENGDVLVEYIKISRIEDPKRWRIKWE